MSTTQISIGEDRSKGPVSSLLLLPDNATSIYVFAHGAGANMQHHFMSDMAEALAERGIATLRFNFPYMESGRRSPDPQPVLEAYVRSACARARELAPALPLFAGGKSMGGRMTSNAVAREPIDGLRGIIFFGFPLHAPNRPALGREAHLALVGVPMLFLQGTRDDLADLGLIKQVCAQLPLTAHLHVVEAADHSFEVLKKSGRTGAEVRAELADRSAAFIQQFSA